ncbi:hypothetical protein K8T06_18380, partial [bacterium]|nr:hypothetical protein [bacterium]
MKHPSLRLSMDNCSCIVNEYGYSRLTKSLMVLHQGSEISIICRMRTTPFNSNDLTRIHVNIPRLEGHIDALSRKFHPRNFMHMANLDRIIDYISNHFSLAGGEVTTQAVTIKSH